MTAPQLPSTCPSCGARPQLGNLNVAVLTPHLAAHHELMPIELTAYWWSIASCRLTARLATTN